MAKIANEVNFMGFRFLWWRKGINFGWKPCLFKDAYDSPGWRIITWRNLWLEWNR